MSKPWTNMVQIENADILESTLRKTGGLLDILLYDQTTQKNIIWATDSYEPYGEAFKPRKQIKPELITGRQYGKLIQPRAVKSREEQRQRTKDKGEVFTSLKIVDQMNKMVDRASVNKQNWQEYVSEPKLEIACGEAPFIVSRYDPVAHGVVLGLKKRVGFLDRKLRIVSKYCSTPKEWLKWAKVAYHSSYGYEWQGDNVLLARENLLYTLTDNYKERFGRKPSLSVQRDFAEIISWNIFQMDGLKYVVPMSCRFENEVIPYESTILGEQVETGEKNECGGCKYNRSNKHNGKYVQIMDWNKKKTLRFVDLIGEI